MLTSQSLTKNSSVKRASDIYILKLFTSYNDKFWLFTSSKPKNTASKFAKRNSYPLQSIIYSLEMRGNFVIIIHFVTMSGKCVNKNNFMWTPGLLGRPYKPNSLTKILQCLHHLKVHNIQNADRSDDNYARISHYGIFISKSPQLHVIRSRQSWIFLYHCSFFLGFKDTKFKMVIIN